MEYIDVRTAAEKWALPERRVTLLCRGGRIAGAKKDGRSWLIPSDAEKPLDGRTKEYQSAEKAETVVEATTTHYTVHGASRNAVRRFEEVYKKAFNGGTPNSEKCGATVSLQLQAIGILKKYKSANGKDFFDSFKDVSKTDGGYVVNKISKDTTPLSTLINNINRENTNGENTYIALCFETGGDDYDSQDCGHVLLIHKIYDGKVYFMENWKNEKYGKGYIRCEEINNFLSPLGFGYGELTNKKNGNTYYIYDGALWFRNPDESSK